MTIYVDSIHPLSEDTKNSRERELLCGLHDTVGKRISVWTIRAVA